MNGNSTEENASARDAREATHAEEALRRQGEEIGATVKERARVFVEEQKDEGARHVSNFARAVGKAADELKMSSPQLAEYTREVASRVDGMSESLRNRSVSDLYHDARDFARREPVAFFGAAMIAGFALSRFLESSAKSNHPPSAGGEATAKAEFSDGGTWS